MSLPIRITTQKQMQEARSALPFCYLCGEALPPRGPGRKKKVTGEHVIPMSVLKLGQTKGDWPVELDVHVGCDEKEKSQLDDVLSVIQRFYMHPSSASLSLLRKQTPVHPIATTPWSIGPPFNALGGTNALVKAVQRWIRGMHAALYGQQLNQVVGVIPPIPLTNPNGRWDFADDAEFAQQAARYVYNSITSDTWDGITAWSGQLLYRCTWLEPEEGDDTWMCAWTLTYPGVLEWSKSVLHSPRPWCGGFGLPQRPTRPPTS